jgi:hypothetical protein
MTGPVRWTASALASLALLASGAPALGAEPADDRDDPAAALQAEYPLHDPGGAPGPQGPAALERGSGAITADGGSGPSSVPWLLIVLATGLALVALAHVLSLSARPPRAPLRSTGPPATRPRRRPKRSARGRRPRRGDVEPKVPAPRSRRTRIVSSKVVRLGAPLLRYSAKDDAVVLRVIGGHFGPALRPDGSVRFTLHDFAFLDPDRSRELGMPCRDHGMLLATDEHGERWTLLADPEAVRALVTEPPYGQVEGTEVAASQFPDRREGWPDDLSPGGST